LKIDEYNANNSNKTNNIKIIFHRKYLMYINVITYSFVFFYNAKSD